MNQALKHRLESDHPPFAGNALCLLPPLASREALVHVVAVTARVLQHCYGRSRLYVLNDWHEHDGYVTDERPCTWDELLRWTQTPDDLAASCSDDWRVHKLVYPEDFAFCLRYWIDVDDDQAHGFDVCGDDDTLHQIGSALDAAGVNGLRTLNAKEYFRARSCE